MFMLTRIWVPLLLAVPLAADVTFYRDVASIMRQKCAQCHRPNDVAPFVLLTVDDAQTWAQDIRASVANRTMPPWKPVPGYGEFRDSFGLTDDERQTILNWVDQGAQPGDPADLPDLPPPPEAAWQLGQPDMVLTMPEYAPPARSRDTYRCFVLPTGLDANVFVSAMQALPGARQEVHHVLVFIDQFDESDKLDGKDGQPGYDCFGGPNVNVGIGFILGGWAPGVRTRNLPDGIGVLVPGKARLVLQVHYHPNGLAVTDKTQIGLWFAPPDSVSKRLVNLPILNDGFKIPAGASDYQVIAQQVVPPFLSGKAIVVAPHMHLLGRKIQVEVVDPDGTHRPMIYIDNWNFNWQGFYTFTDAVRIPGNAKIVVTANYDNSENNPLNPNNPLKTVGWGEGTEDEMCLAIVGMVFDNESLIPFRAGRAGK
jgi:copper type II ascorbate-dependent monooxygenase-like protein